MELVFIDNLFNSKQTHTLFPLSFVIDKISSTEKQTYVLDKEGYMYTCSRSVGLGTFMPHLKVVSMSCGRQHIAIITDSMHVYTWGNGESGALGMGSVMSFNEPQLLNISSDYLISEVFCGGWHTMILTRYQTERNFILAMGRNSEGQLGTGKLNRELLPCRVNLPEEILKISCGTNHTIAITQSKSLYSTGDNRFGQLGLGHKKNIVMFTRVDIEKVEAISCGHHSAAIACNKVYVWGTLTFGEILKPCPILGPQVPKIISVGDGIGCAIDIEKKLWVWGKNRDKAAIRLDFTVDIISLNSGINVLVSEDIQNTKIRGNSISNSINSNINSPKAPRLDKKIRSKESSYRKLIKDVRFHSTKSQIDLSNTLHEDIDANYQQDFENEKEDFDKKSYDKNLEIIKINKELQDTLKENSNLKDIINKISSENEKFAKSSNSDNETKAFYEKLIVDLEHKKDELEENFRNEIKSLKYENDNIQDMLVELRTENNTLSCNLMTSQDAISILEQNLRNSQEIISNLESKVLLLQEQLSDSTAANHALYSKLEKNLSNQSRDLRVEDEYFNKPLRPNENFDEDELKLEDLNINRKGLSALHQQKISNAAAAKMIFDEPPTNLRAVSPLSRDKNSKKNSKNTYEDLRNKVKSLKQSRSSIKTHMQEFEKRFH